ncbi:hypothetical protein CTI12_AA002290 [Artemisia annua]|uniref:Uncharacterized protein n=1 Tax=Artemisia annua TaxID=35608 RepID=A0A2U1QNX8_ARTAN|nr:hypothetical protein CTI12_AA002290 [Artemisia annua]
MSTTIPSFAHVTTLSIHKVHRASTRLDIRAHGFRDEGRSSNHVDSSMKLLKDRIEVMRTKERLEKSCRPNGWDYDLNYLMTFHNFFNPFCFLEVKANKAINHEKYVCATGQTYTIYVIQIAVNY